MRTVDTHTDVGGVFQAVILPTSSPFSSAVSQICTENSRFSHCPLTRPAATLSPGGDERVKSTISTLPSPPSGERGRGSIVKLFQIHNTSLTQRRALRAVWLFI